MGKSINIDLEEMKALYEQGLSDNEIAKKLGCSRKTIARRRNKLGLEVNYWQSPIWKQVKTIKQMFSEGKSGAEICNAVNVSHTTLAKFKKLFSVKSKYDTKMSEEDIKKAMSLAEEGLMDTEIAKMFGVTRGNINVHRKRKGIQSKFTYDKISKIDKEKFEQLFNEGLGDEEIGKMLGMSSDGIYSHRMRHKFYREKYSEAKNNPLTQDNLEIILGTMMGDASMERPNVNARMTFAHCPQQREYRDYIADKLSNLNPHLYHYIAKPHCRTGKIYESYWCCLPTNPAFNILYEHFYRDGKKRIPIELFDNFTWQSLAYMYMDDGIWRKSGGCIATNCFSRHELKTFQEFLLSKFNLKTSIFKTNILYIKAESFRLMKSRIEPYMCECMKYKIR